MFRAIVTAAAAAFLFAADAAPAASEPGGGKNVTMHLIGGGLSIKGQLIGFDGKQYRVRSETMGIVALDADKFECVDGACPGRPQGAPALSAALPKAFAIHGSSTIGGKLMPALIRGYAQSIGAVVTRIVGTNPKEVAFELRTRTGETRVRIDLYKYGSVTAFPALAGQRAEIGMSDRPIRPEERLALAKAGYPEMSSPAHQHAIGLDGILVIVSPKNPVTSLSEEQIAQIFAGKIRTWSEIGGPPVPITIYAPDENSGTFGTFRSLLLKPRKLTLAATARRFASNARISDLVAQDTGGIGMTGFAYKRNAKALAIATACGIIHEPSLFNVKTQTYPLSRQLYLYTTTRLRHPDAKGLLRFILSPEAQPIFAATGFMDQSIAELPFGAQGGRIAAALNAPAGDFDMKHMQKLVAQLRTAHRLTPTFRFEAGSSRLDSTSQRAIRQLIAFMQKPDMLGRTLILAGFTDSEGSFAQNRNLSLSRAKKVRTALLQAAGDAIDPAQVSVEGFGELMPIVCNDSQAGRHKNRRVEVWIKDTVVARAAKFRPAAGPAPTAKNAPPARRKGKKTKITIQLPDRL